MSISGAPPTMVGIKKAPTRRMNRNDKALMRTANWVDNSDLILEDKVSLANLNATFLQGLVVYVGKVSFDKGTWVGIQLTGPSIGRGNCSGVVKGKKYFADVGKNNGIMAPLHKVSKRVPTITGDPEADKTQIRRMTENSRLADLQFIDALTQERALAMLKLSEDKQRKPFANMFSKEETHITRLKHLRLAEVMRSRGADSEDLASSTPKQPNLKYAPRDAPLQDCDLELAEGLELTQQNYCLSDPTLPDNPITFASQAFLNMSGYNLNEILGRNCRFLQGPKTDDYAVYRIRLSIVEGSDCHVVLLNYRKDGSPFYNRLFMTALRDTRGRVKNYLGVQCEVTEAMAHRINAEEKSKLENKLASARMSATEDMSEHEGSVSQSVHSASDEPRLSRSSSSRGVGEPRLSRSGSRTRLPPWAYDDEQGMSSSARDNHQEDSDTLGPRRQSAPSLATLSEQKESLPFHMLDIDDICDADKPNIRRRSTGTLSTLADSSEEGDYDEEAWNAVQNHF